MPYNGAPLTRGLSSLSFVGIGVEAAEGVGEVWQVLIDFICVVADSDSTVLSLLLLNAPICCSEFEEVLASCFLNGQGE